MVLSAALSSWGCCLPLAICETVKPLRCCLSVKLEQLLQSLPKLRDLNWFSWRTKVKAQDLQAQSQPGSSPVMLMLTVIRSPDMFPVPVLVRCSACLTVHLCPAAAARSWHSSLYRGLFTGTAESRGCGMQFWSFGTSVHVDAQTLFPHEFNCRSGTSGHAETAVTVPRITITESERVHGSWRGWRWESTDYWLVKGKETMEGSPFPAHEDNNGNRNLPTSLVT